MTDDTCHGHRFNCTAFTNIPSGHSTRTTIPHGRPSSLLRHWSRNGHRLEATCPVSMFLEASRALTPLPRCYSYGMGRAFWEGEVMSRSTIQLHCFSQHPSGHSPALRHNHSHLTSIRESSSPIATNQALYKTVLILNTHCLVSRLQALHLFHHLPAGSLLLCGCLPPVDSTKGRDKDY